MSGFASIYGGSGDEHLAPGALNSDDYIGGRGGDDTILGLGGNDTLVAGSGDDMVLAGNGNDLVYGGRGADTLLGEGGADTLDGGSGNDLLQGGSGDDQLSGGSGHDTFDFSDNFGHDLILGFQIGQDVLQISHGINGTTLASPADVLSHVSADAFGNAVITLGTDTITLSGVAPTDLTVSNIASIVHVI